MTDSKTHTITLKGAMNEPWLVLGGASLDELETSLLQAFPELDPQLELPELIWRAQAMWAAIRALVVGGLVGGAEATTPAAQPAQPAYPANGQQTGAQGSSGASGPAPACQHGPMQWVTAKPGSGKSWKGWFCPLPQNAEGKCKPKFVN